MRGLLIKPGGQAHSRAIRQEKPFPQDVSIDDAHWVAIPAGRLERQVIGLVFVPAKVMQTFLR